MRRRATGQRQPTGWSKRLLSPLTLLLVATAIGCCGEGLTPAPVVVRPHLPAQLPDERYVIRERWGEVAYVGTMVHLPADLWRKAGAVSAAGWANAEALKRAGSWDTGQ